MEFPSILFLFWSRKFPYGATQLTETRILSFSGNIRVRIAIL
jgi:hypothetical protein